MKKKKLKIKYKTWTDLKNDKRQQAIYRENIEFVSSLYSLSDSK